MGQKGVRVHLQPVPHATNAASRVGKSSGTRGPSEQSTSSSNEPSAASASSSAGCSEIGLLFFAAGAQVREFSLLGASNTPEAAGAPFATAEDVQQDARGAPAACGPATQQQVVDGARCGRAARSALCRVDQCPQHSKVQARGGEHVEKRCAHGHCRGARAVLAYKHSYMRATTTCTAVRVRVHPQRADLARDPVHSSTMAHGTYQCAPVPVRIRARARYELL